MASDNNIKPWEKPWSMDEIIDCSDKWSLAGDAALLSTVTNFANNLLSKTLTLNDNVDGLLNNLNEVGVKLDLATNEFSSLRNTQFIESRVYEDDETLEIKNEDKEEKKQISEEERDRRITDVVLNGLKIMDKYYDKVTVPVSDSEDEVDTSYVLKPKDAYAHRPLPYVIGSDEWYKESHIGLEDSDVESESEKSLEVYSSDSESDVSLTSEFSRNKSNVKASETSSELDFSVQTSSNKPVANSTFNDSVRQPDLFESSSDSEGMNSVPVQAPISNKSFAEQLAAKLGSVISHEEIIPEPEINRKPIQKVEQKSNFVGLFSDEPPPLDELDDTVLPSNVQSGLFSGGTGLFDDVDDDNDLFSAKEYNDKAKDISKNEEQTSDIKQKGPQVSKGLFDSEESDDDIFSARKSQLSKPPFLQPFKTTVPLFDDEPPEINKKPEETKKKPTGGVSIFGASNILNDSKIGSILKKCRTSSTESSESEKEPPINETAKTERIKTNKYEAEDTVKHVESKIPQKEETTKSSIFDDEVKVKKNVETKSNNAPKKISLFGDETDNEPTSTNNNNLQGKDNTKKTSLFDDDLFQDDLFSSVSNKKFSSNLFDEDDGDIFGKDVAAKASKVDLFDGLDDKDEDIFSKTKKEQEKVGFLDSVITKENMETKKPENDVESSDKRSNESSTIGNRQVIGAETSNKIVSLFDDEPISDDDLFKIENDNSTVKPNLKTSLFNDEDDALFSNNESPPTLIKREKTPPKHPQVPAVNIEEPSPKPVQSKTTQQKSRVSLFDSTPPPVDEWETDNVFDEVDQYSYSEEYSNVQQSSLFDNEPPSLGPNESSGIVRDLQCNTIRSDTDGESSFNPYASSSRRLSSDIFSEDQSNDSFYVTKSKSEAPLLESIQEISKTSDFASSDVDITPSGNIEDFESTNDQTPKSKKTVSLFDDLPTVNAGSSENRIEDHSQSELLQGDISGDNRQYSDEPVSISDKVDDEVPFLLQEDRGENNDMNVASIREKFQGKMESEHVSLRAKNTAPPGKLRHSFNNLDPNAMLPSSVPLRKKDSGAEDPKSDAKKKPSNVSGKLRHSLNIDVNALLPGLGPPKKKEPPKTEKEEPIKIDDSTSTKAKPSKTVTPKTKSDNKDEKSVKKPDTTSSKLRHSLNIDVNALLPGLGPPKKKEPLKTENEKPIKNDDLKPTAATANKIETPETKSDKNDENPDILYSVTKDRPKIQVKRRPSTKRGREIFRKSVADFNEEYTEAIKEESSTEIVSKSTEDEEKEKTEDATDSLDESRKEEVISPTNTVDEISESDDLFGSRTILDKDISNKSNTSLFDSPDSGDLFDFKKPSLKKEEKSKLDPEDIFDFNSDDEKRENEEPKSSSLDSDELFKPTVIKEEKQDISKSTSFEDIFDKPKSKPSSAPLKSEKSSIFDDELEDDDLFATKKKPVKLEVSKKSLFDDDDDDDLFGTSTSSKSSEPVQSNKVKKVPKTVLKKLENQEAHDDPLSDLLN